MTTAAWFDFISELYPKWIAFDDYEPAAELEVFFNQLGTFGAFFSLSPFFAVLIWSLQRREGSD